MQIVPCQVLRRSWWAEVQLKAKTSVIQSTEFSSTPDAQGKLSKIPTLGRNGRLHLTSFLNGDQAEVRARVRVCASFVSP